ncbi:FecR family protein [Ancylobacter oerskovii]|uniref:FecR family protein n=1 Tax=Ancylobacter oerskovii TaxID=459519 RepID=A0ABW4YU21_9HYPH|nr:FecR domain-containing protein [Ancylobacter oerskovii]MBS7543231.1 FecR domain-containing protein [Ancylobacter oerskovii]
MISDEEDPVGLQAVAWFTRMNGRPSEEDRRDFGRWLAAASAHREAYEKLRAMWGDLHALADMPAVRQDAGLAGLRARIEEKRRRARRLASGVALGLAMLVAGSWVWLERPHLLQDLRADYVAPRGEPRSVGLADGSVLLLDADTAIEVDLGAGQRRVEVLRGTVFFRVKPSSIPFVVAASNGEARVLGTEFDVARREGGDVTVTLDSGSVEVGLTDRDGAVTLRPGESVDYGGQGLGAPHTVDLEEAGAWRQGRFIFTNARLADVLERIGRYRDGRIVVIGSALAETRVSGNISLRDTEAALAAVRSSVGFPLHEIGRLTLIGP